MLTRLGATPATTSVYAQWTEAVKALLIDRWGDDWRVHGGPSVIPWNVPPLMQAYIGKPAAMFDNVTYTELANSGMIDMKRPQVASNNGRVVFVLAPPAVIAAAPQTMTPVQAAANAIFTAGDIAADAAGLPSLADVSDSLKDIGRQVLIGVGVALGVAFVISRMRK